MAQQILGSIGSYISSHSPVGLEDVSTAGCKALEQVMSRTSLRTLFGFSALTCAVVGNANTVDRVSYTKSYDVFDYIDPLIGTNDGGKKGIFTQPIRS